MKNRLKTVVVVHMIITIVLIIMVNSKTSMAMSKMKAMYVLGDSSVDCGENTLFFPFLLNNLSLHPCDGPPSSLLPHLLAKKIGLAYPIPFYSQNGSTEVLLRGVNLGSTGATIMSNPTNPVLQSLNQQLRQAFEIFQLLQLELGQEAANDFIQSSTLFYLSFGKDDYIDLFRRKVAGYNSQFMYRILVDQMANAIEYLYNSSVRKFVFMGILPLGCAPRFSLSKKDSVSGGTGNGNGNGDDRVVCADEINYLVLEYNSFLEQRIASLNEELAGAQLIFCDVFRAMMEIINNPNAYGFENVKRACCGKDDDDDDGDGCMSMNMVCEAPSTYVWWDLFNPGRVVSSLIADSAWSGQLVPHICRPTTIHQLVSS